MGWVLGGGWRLLEPLRPFFDVIFVWLHLGWFSNCLLEASGLDFDSILADLEGILGGFGGGFGRDLTGFCLILGYSGLFWIIGKLLDDLGSILAGAACFLACFC